MARYIDADEFLKYEIKRNGCVPFIDGGNYNVDRLNDELNNFPTADVQEVRHGKWKKSQAITGIDPETLEVKIGNTDRCSVCDTEFLSKKCKYKYCPNCGAKMDGKEDEK